MLPNVKELSRPNPKRQERKGWDALLQESHDMPINRVSMGIPEKMMREPTPLRKTFH